MMLKIDQLNFSYSDTPFISDLDLHINAGENVAIIGPNGSGKSTLVKLMAGILQPQKGTIKVQDNTIDEINRKHMARLTAYVPQSVDVSFNFGVREVVAMGRYPHAQTLIVQESNSIAIINKMLTKMELNDLASRNFSELSGGEKQRVIIASALAQQSKLLLLDEPTSALDLKHQQEIYQLLKDLCQSEGKTVLVVTHDVNLAAQYCDRLILLNNGKIINDGTPEEVLKFPVIEEVYGVKVYIDINPFNKSLYIIPYALDSDSSFQSD